MNLDDFKVATKEQLKAYGDAIPWRNTYDSNGNLLTFHKKSTPFWFECTYDSNNNRLTHKDLTGYWAECTYDSDNNRLTHKDSDGSNRIVLIKGTTFTLYYDIDSNKYVAGCETLTYDECIEYYKEFEDEYKDADLFLDTIKKHQLTLEK